MELRSTGGVSESHIAWITHLILYYISHSTHHISKLHPFFSNSKLNNLINSVCTWVGENIEKLKRFIPHSYPRSIHIIPYEQPIIYVAVVVVVVVVAVAV